MYHSVGDELPDPWSIRVTPKYFEEHLEVLKRLSKSMAFSNFAKANQEKTLEHGSVAVTFDDGYANNLHRAKPLLEKYEIPGTVFVASDFVKEGKHYWWDLLSEVLLSPGRLPDRLQLEVDGLQKEWLLGSAADYSVQEANDQSRTLASEAEPGSRLRFFYEIWEAIHVAPVETHLPLLEQICAWAGKPFDPPIDSYRPMNPDELILLEQGGLVGVGGHTANHPQLSFQSEGVQRDEIFRCKTDLEAMLNHPVTGFAYPYGGRSSATVSLVEEAGFRHAVTTYQESVWYRSRPFELPRIEITNIDGDEFERRLTAWLNR